MSKYVIEAEKPSSHWGYVSYAQTLEKLLYKERDKTETLLWLLKEANWHLHPIEEAIHE